MNLFTQFASNLLYPLIRRCHIPLRPPSIDSQQLDVLRAILSTLQAQEKDTDHLLSSLSQISSKLDTLTTIATLLGEIALDLSPEPPPDRTTSTQISFGDSQMAAPGVLTVGSTLTAHFDPLLADGVTVNTTTTLTTQPTWSSSDSTIATVTANSDGTALVTGVGAGTATITASQGSFTDSDSVVAGPFDASNTVSDTAPVQRTASAQVSFS